MYQTKPVLLPCSYKHLTTMVNKNPVLLPCCYKELITIKKSGTPVAFLTR
jgi:hypothetical protein